EVAMTRRRLVIGLGLVLLLCAGAWWTFFVHSRSAYDRIQLGMTQSEVESVIGQPAGDYSDPRFRASKVYIGKVRKSGIRYQQTFGDPRWEFWTWDSHQIGVAFDKDGKAVGHFLIESSLEPPGFFDRLRANIALSRPSDLPDDLSKSASDKQPIYAGQSLAYWRYELKQLPDIKPDIPLGRIGDPEAIPVLLELLKDADMIVRYKAALCLGW